MDGAKVVAVAASTVFVKTTWLPFRFSLAMTGGADAKVHLHCEQWDQTIAEHLVLAERYLAFHQPDAMYSFHDVGKGQGMVGPSGFFRPFFHLIVLLGTYLFVE